MVEQAASFESEGPAHGPAIDALARRVGILPAS
jgi:hypothetical protein